MSPISAALRVRLLAELRRAGDLGATLGDLMRGLDIADTQRAHEFVLELVGAGRVESVAGPSGRRYVLARGALASCRVCGCTELDCSACVARTGTPCWWVEVDLCSACERERRRQ